MPRSTTIWTAALLLASMSGSGPMLTTAEAMPAPGPQQTAMRPRYYFPRQIKRQIVTNSTAPAPSTSSTSSSSSTPGVESRQSSGDLTSFFESLFRQSPDASSSSSSEVLTSTTTVVMTPVPIPVPSGTGDVVFDPSTSSTPSVAQSPSDAVPSSPPPPPPPSSSPEPKSPEPVPEVGSTGGIPSSIVEPTGPARIIPSSIAVPTDVPEILSSVLPSIGSTGGVPASEPAPTSAEASPTPSPKASEPADAPLDSSGAASTGGIPESIVPPSSSPPAEDKPTPTADSTILGPFIIPGSTGGVPTSVVQPTPSIEIPVPSDSIDIPLGLPTGSTGGLPIVLPTSDIQLSSALPVVPLPTTGIVVGITTAFGTSESETPSPTESPSAPIPTSESKTETEGLPLIPSLLSSLVSELTSVLAPTQPLLPTSVLPTPSVPGVSDSAPGPTAPATESPIVTPSPILPSLSLPLIPTSDVLSIPLSLPDVPSLLSSVVSDLPTIIPIPTGTGILSSVLPTLPTDPTTPILPTTPLLPPTLSISTTEIPVTIPTSVPTLIPTTLVPTDPLTSVPGTGSSGIPIPTTTSGIIPPSSSGYPTGTGVSSGPTDVSSSLPTDTAIPTSEETSSSPVPTVIPSSSDKPSNSTGIPTSEPAITTATPTTSKPAGSSPFSVPFTLQPSETGPIRSILPTATNSDTSYNVGTSIIYQPSTAATASATGIPTDIATWIQPPEGMPSSVPDDKFLGQMGFYFGLNYEFVAQNDGGNQIFEYLPIAISEALNISRDQVENYGLRAVDTSQWRGFITTLAVFMIPKDLNDTLALQLRTPATPFWHNSNETVNQLTSLVDPSFPLPYGKYPGDWSPSATDGPLATATGGVKDGGALGSDMGASHPVNATSAGIAVGTITAAVAYGAAMFFVARRYRNKRMSHQRTSSVPSTSRYTYGSVGNGPAWMSGGRGPGRYTPGGRDSRGSRGSSSSNGRSVRTQQISAPVMAENSLGWN